MRHIVGQCVVYGKGHTSSVQNRKVLCSDMLLTKALQILKALHIAFTVIYKIHFLIELQHIC